MKILVICTAAQKEELLAYPVHTDALLTWLEVRGNAADHTGIDACIDLLFENNTACIGWLNQLNTPLIVINSVVVTLEQLGQNFIRINGWNTFLKRSFIEAAGNNEVLKRKAANLFLLLGRQTEWVNDIPGFITPRVVACIINEAYMALEEDVSVEEEMNIAMKLGTNYPYGPFEWAQRIGLYNVFHLLDTLSKAKIRYHPSRLLEENALA